MAGVPAGSQHAPDFANPQGLAPPAPPPPPVLASQPPQPRQQPPRPQSQSPQATAAGRPVPVARSAKQAAIGADSNQPRGHADQEDVLQEVVKNAPPWLISTVVHTAVVILLGIWVTVKHQQQDDSQINAEMVYAEQLGEQLEDPSVLIGSDNPTPDAKEQIITPQDLAPVDDPFAAPPRLPDLGLQGTTGFSDIDAPDADSIGRALSGREIGSKNVLLGKYGGTETTEAAVVNGLLWLAKQQKPDGSWSLLGPYQDGGQDENFPAATAMALLAFQGHGDTHQRGKFQDNVTRGWKFLIKQQGKDGNFVHAGPSHQRLYAHAQCTIALCELYGMTNDSNFRRPAELAIKYCLTAQDKRLGGWRYTPGDDSDTSVTGWFVMALQSARMAKLEVPESVFDLISKFLDSVQLDGGRRYTYTQGTFSTQAVTAEGLLCRQYLGWKQSDERLMEGVAKLNENRVDYNANEQDVYYWYYATQACHHMEGKIWDDWNSVMRQAVPARQTKKGAESGSWDPEGDKWGSYGGRLYVTCLSIYMLEVYYRHLPIYSGYKFAAGK
jgi:hypothetical protein